MSIDGSPEENHIELNYKVKTEGFRKASLRKTESITRKSIDGTKLHHVILFYESDDDTTPLLPTTVKIATYSRSIYGGWYFDQPYQNWSGSYSDISLLEDVLADKFPNPGQYQLLTGDPNVDGLAKKILAGEMPIESADQILKALADNPDAHDIFKKSDASQVFADTVNQYRQRQAVDDLELIAKEPTTLEAGIQKLLQKQWWIFGGRYIDIEKRRSLVVLDQLDLPLIRSDGSLHIVELKQANIPKLIIKHRNHLVVGEDISQAVSQAMNYLVSLDEQRAQILTDLKVDARRASATVVVGHTDFVTDFSPEEVHETLRIYNSHLSRVEVITYDELISGARQSLALSE